MQMPKSKDGMMKRSVFNIVTSLFYKLLVCVVGIIIPRIFILNYGSEINGLQGSVSQIFTYIALLEAGVGAATLQALFAPISKNNYKRANEILSATTLYYDRIGFIYFGILLVLSFIYPLIVDIGSLSYLTVFLYIVISGAITGFNFFYKAKILLVMSACGDNHIDSLINMVIFAMSSIAKIVLVSNGINIVLVQSVYLAINLLATLGYYIVAKRRYPWLDFRTKPDVDAIGQKNYALIHKISSIIFQNVDVLLLTFIADLKLVSIYSMYKMVVNMIASVVGSLGDSINFVIGQSYNGNDSDNFAIKIDTFNVFYSAISFALYCTTYVLIIPFLKLYTVGMDVNYIIDGLPFLYVLIEILQVGREAMIRTINVAGRFHETIYSTIVETVLNIVASVVAMFAFKYTMGARYTLYGALIGTIIALVYRTFDVNYYANRKILSRSAWHSNKIILTNSVFFVAVMVFSRFYIVEVNSYMEFFLKGAIVTIIMLVLELATQCVLNPNELRYLVRKLRHT